MEVPAEPSDEHLGEIRIGVGVDLPDRFLSVIWRATGGALNPAHSRKVGSACAATGDGGVLPQLDEGERHDRPSGAPRYRGCDPGVLPSIRGLPGAASCRNRDASGGTCVPLSPGRFIAESQRRGAEWLTRNPTRTPHATEKRRETPSNVEHRKCCCVRLLAKSPGQSVVPISLDTAKVLCNPSSAHPNLAQGRDTIHTTGSESRDRRGSRWEITIPGPVPVPWTGPHSAVRQVGRRKETVALSAFCGVRHS